MTTLQATGKEVAVPAQSSVSDNRSHLNPTEYTAASVEYTNDNYSNITVSQNINRKE